MYLYDNLGYPADKINSDLLFPAVSIRRMLRAILSSRSSLGLVTKALPHTCAQEERANTRAGTLDYM